MRAESEINKKAKKQLGVVYVKEKIMYDPSHGDKKLIAEAIADTVRARAIGFKSQRGAIHLNM